jgi:hypothetical protein
VAPLFNPRQDCWTDHFVLQGVRVQGLTPTGRATLRVLAMNDARRLDLRSALLTRGGLG